MTELLNKSFGVASYNRKLSKKHKKIHNPTKMRPIVDFTTDTTREQVRRIFRVLIRFQVKLRINR